MGSDTGEDSSTLVFFVNGRKIKDDSINPEWTLLYYLRNKLRLCGTKLGCGEGGCGACTVMVSHYEPSLDKIIHRSVNACLAPVAAMHGMAVTTVEGIGSTRTKLHAVQRRIAESHGSQCGFCTPGIVMSMYALLRNNHKPSMHLVETALQGNLCRCTGYRPILEGFLVFTEEWERKQVAQYVNGANGVNGMNGANGVNGSNGVCALGDKCCKNQVNGGTQKEDVDEQLFKKSEFVPYDPSQEPIFPPELRMSAETYNNSNLILKGKRTTWYRPTSLELLLDLKAKHPDVKSRIVVGNTEVGVEAKNRKTYFPVLIHPTRIPELLSVTKQAPGLRLGAAVTLTDLENELRREMQHQPEYKTRIFREIVEILHWFAGKQIRNVSAIGGNLMTSSPISDLNPIYLAAGVEIEVQSKERGKRTIKMDHNFFTGYRQNVVKPDEVLVAVTIPYTTKPQYFRAYKQAKRRDDDIAIVNIAVNVVFEPDLKTVKDISVAFGGMAATTVLATSVPGAAVGRPWDEKTLEDIYAALLHDLPLPPSAPGGMASYRRSLTLSLFFKAYLAICKDVGRPVPPSYESGATGFITEMPKSSQYFRVPLPGQKDSDPVGRPMVHKSAEKQATGEAVYCDDIPHYANELYLTLVLSSHAHAIIKSIDATRALQRDGVVAFFSAKDIPDHQNRFGMRHDEEIFASTEVTCHGQVIGAIVAVDQVTGQEAAKLVTVDYEVVDDAIVTLEDAIKKKSYYSGFPRTITKGDVARAFFEADHVLSGEVRMGGQEHFYLETNACIAVPKGEDDEMEVICSTQNPTEIQKLVAEMLGVQSNKVVCRVKRMGGGFGGKESRCPLLALPVTWAAHSLNQPVRCALDRDEDMMITGTRHPFLARYKVAFSKQGRLLGCDIELYNNAGNTMDLSQSVLERAMFHFQNSYLIPNVKVSGYVCKTNIPSNTAFRGFGGPQGMFFGENMIRDIARFLGKDPAQVASLNLYKEGDRTHYNQPLENCTLQNCWSECLLRSGYESRKAQVKDFNKKNRWKKRGISMVPTMFGISFTALFLNQAGALVLVYDDGSVLLTHGGTEMGQGLHTKMIQVASRALGIPHEYIHISETSTDKVPNTSPTAASAGSDLNGMAVMNACQTIVDRLKPYREANPKGQWKEWVKKAYFDRVSLSATGFYRTPGIGYDWDKNEGCPFSYFTYGAACSEVEVDCLTGDHQVRRTDIVMDLGESLNPAIDVGQVEGGFVQGYGLFTLEETLHSPKGAVFTRGPGFYKIPGFADIPAEFNVSLLKGASNPRAVYSSKAVGEPPLFLASSIFFAIKEAISSARQDAGKDPWFRLDSPATAERIRMAAADHITDKLSEAEPGSYTPFFVKA